MHQPPKILIVDDTPLNVDLLEQALDELGYQTVTAFDGQAALEQIVATQPDLVLLDIMMPVMDGFEVLMRVKADPATHDLPVIVISALSDMSSIVRGIEMGADDFLPKPFEPAILRARLQNSLDKKRWRDAEQLIARANERELDIGREMQASFLPQELPRVEGWEFAAYFQAARQVAGDLYDVFPLSPEKRIGIFIGDVSDKGVGAALYMALFRTLLRAALQWDEFGRNDSAIAQDDAARLGASIRLTNNYVASMHGHTSMFATLFAGLLNPTTGELIYANQGHMPPLVLNAQGIRMELGATGIPLGIAPRETFTVRAAQLERGETLLLYSDGVTDAQNANREFWDEAALLTAIRAFGAESPTVLLEKIVARVNAHVNNAPRFDDMTLVALKRLNGE
jgi:serine phosphatase RsbU (regulator of sigma subunit)